MSNPLAARAFDGLPAIWNGGVPPRVAKGSFQKQLVRNVCLMQGNISQIFPYANSTAQPSENALICKKKAEIVQS